ncbi:hypothetical protein [Nostoc sp. NMS4]|uniref:hypothetical protein n=1 Tax=Nostoc sp. NMS4 TaxID=2815390 RepID=UPI0026013C58|nr:hypothetical protein [Nostoc sp. NMS4]MBN3924886.1 hypothetical protein [Nostoc sp. NMS4]
MVRTPSKNITLAEFLKLPEEQTVFVYIRNQQPVMFDELEALLPVPDFASELRLTVGDLFGWLLE